MDAAHFIIATAGHVDHGKSALVKALTGIDPDRLPEEKARGITIDLGFAHLALPALAPSGAAGPGFHLGIVDVPGHEAFVKNMVAGVGAVDLALFVVAADDGWMPQTEEHLQILAYLGVSQAVVVLTKIDLVPGREAAAEEAVCARLEGTPFAQAPVVRTSVLTGEGLDELKAALARVLARTPPPPDLGKPRLPVDRVFTLAGLGTIATGTLSGGTLRRGDRVLVQPAGHPAHIRSLQSHNRDLPAAGPGTRVALNLPELSAGKKKLDHAALRRGDVVTLPGCGAPSAMVDVLLEMSGRPAGTAAPAAPPLKHSAQARLHQGSGNIRARVLLWEGHPLEPGGRALARVRLDSPALLFGGDRFLLRDLPGQHTLAGGIVLDPDAARARFRAPAQLRLLQQRAQSPADPATWAASELARDHALLRASLLVKSRFSAGQIEAAVARLGDLAQTLGAWLVEIPWWGRLCQLAAQAIRADHQAHPQRAGLPLTELRRLLAAELPGPELFPALLAELGRAGFAQMGGAVGHRDHRPALPARLEAAGARLRSALDAAPFEPPTRKELAPDESSQEALRFLLETGEVIELSDQTLLLARHFTRAIELIRPYLQQRGAATASELRQLLGTNRRVIIPLLERLDREGITHRQGDKRTLG